MLTLGSNIFSPYVYMILLRRMYGEMNTHIFWLLIFFFSPSFLGHCYYYYYYLTPETCVCVLMLVSLLKIILILQLIFFIVYIYSPCTCIAPSSH